MFYFGEVRLSGFCFFFECEVWIDLLCLIINLYLYFKSYWRFSNGCCGFEKFLGVLNFRNGGYMFYRLLILVLLGNIEVEKVS